MATTVRATWFGEKAKAATRAGLHTAANNGADLARSSLHELTPVDTGRLVGSMDAKVEERGGEVGIVFGAMDNPPDYALPVEAGHHTRSGSWVPGINMVRRTADRVATAYPNMIRGNLR